MIDAYIIHLLIIFGIYLISALSLQFSLGFTGIFNLGHIAFYCIGAYITSLLSIQGFSFIICILASGIGGMFLGFLIALLANKIKGDYFVLITLSFSLLIYAIVLNWRSLTGGVLGISGIPRPDFLGINFSENFNFLILTLILTLICYLFIRKITSSPFGTVLQAIRDNELMVKILGKNTFKMKLLTLLTSSFIAGVAGALYAYYMSFIHPSSFTLLQFILFLCIVIVGGLASLKGTVVATLLLVFLPESLRFIGFSPSVIGPLRQMIYSLILILILVYRPRGFYGNVKLE